MFWLDRTPHKSGAATLHGFSAEAADPTLTQELEKLDHVLFGSSTTPEQVNPSSWRQLLRQVSRARTLRFSHTKRTAEKEVFGSLNPGAKKI